MMELSPPRPRGLSIGGVVPVRSVVDLQHEEAQETAREREQERGAEVVVSSLAAKVRHDWVMAREDRNRNLDRMLRGVRALRGEYDPDTSQRLREQGSSSIYMMLFATKARQFKALLSDVLLGTSDDKPWTLSHTPLPDLDPAMSAQIVQEVTQVVAQAELGGQQMPMEQVRQMMRDAKAQVLSRQALEARQSCADTERRLHDKLVEGGFVDALDAFVDDMTTFPTAYIKGPVVRRVGALAWKPTQGGGFSPTVAEVLQPFWERVDPLNVYHAPWARDVGDGFIIEHHRLTPASLEALRGVEGYDDKAISEVLVGHTSRSIEGWMGFEERRAQAEGRSTLFTGASTGELIDAIQYWGAVTGQMLRDWGLDEGQVPDPAKVYEVEVWLIGTHVIKAMVNPDPLARRPYYACSFKRVPGTVLGMSLFDAMADCQAMCNAAARALANNMGIASGPQVWVNVDRMPPGEDITAMYPWKITQFGNDNTGSSAPPMGFFQPGSNASELMGVFEKFSQLADEYTGVPRYMTGDGAMGGAGRTASGMSMMVGNAGKTVKSLMSSIDRHVIGPLIERAYEYLLRFDPDAGVAGDLRVMARGVLSLMTRESAQVRRNEFLNIALNSPVAQQIIGPEGVAALLRAQAKTLELDTRDIVPPDSEVRLRAAQAAQANMALQQAAENPKGQMPQNGPTASAELQNGAPVVDNFGA